MSEVPATLCGACLSPLAAGARFCSRCGTSVHAAAHPPRWPELKVALQLWALLILCSGGIGVAMNITGSESLVYDLTGTIGFAVLVVAFAAMMWRDIAPTLSPARLNPRATVAALLAAGGLLVFIHLYMAGLSILAIEEIPLLEQYRSNDWPLWSAFVLIAACPAVFEEIAFRGIIYERLKRVGGPREALVLQAAMFSIIHLLPGSFISHFVIGLILGWLRQRSGSLLPGIITHFVYNASLVFLEMTGW